jgi:hypothetical protein
MAKTQQFSDSMDEKKVPPRPFLYFINIAPRNAQHFGLFGAAGQGGANRVPYPALLFAMGLTPSHSSNLLRVVFVFTYSFRDNNSQ